MTDGKVLDQTICNLPFEVVAIYDNGSQILQNNTNSNLPPVVNVKIRIRNKEETGTGRHGIISVPKLTAKNWPKRVRLVNSAQTIMSFNLAMEPNSDEAQKKSNRSLFQMFRPGGCLSIHKDEDYSYMPSTSNDLNRKSTSGIEVFENSKITRTFALKKNDFSSSYTNTIKTQKTFLGKCKPGGCLDPPFSEDKYTYKPTVEDVRSLQQPVIDTNSLHSDINIMDIKTKNTAQDQRINTLHHSYPETKILGHTETLVTYPSSTLSSSKLKTKDSPNKKPILRMLSEQVELSRKLTNEFPEAYFTPPRKEKPKTELSYDKNSHEEKEPKIKESYINRDYILQSQTPSELLSDALTIVSTSDNPSQSNDEPLRGVIKEKQMIRDFNSITPLLLKSEDILSNKTSKDDIQTISTTVSAKVMEIDDNTFPKDQNCTNHYNNPIIQNIYSNIKESKKVINDHISSLNSSIQVNAIQDTAEGINYKKNEDPNNNLYFKEKRQSNINYKKNEDQNGYSDFEKKRQSMLDSLDLSNEISVNPSKNSINLTRISSDHYEKREENNLLGQNQRVINKDEITNSLHLSNEISVKPSKSSINQTRLSLDHFEKREEHNLLGQNQKVINKDEITNSLHLSNEISVKPSKSSINQTRLSLDHFEKREEHNLLGQNQKVINKAEITNSLDLRNEISVKPSKSSINQTRLSLDHFEKREEHNLLGQNQKVINKAEITNSLDLRNEISVKPSKSSINQTKISLDHFEKREEHNLLGQNQNVINKAEITNSLDLSNEILVKPSKSSINQTKTSLDHFEKREQYNLLGQNQNVINKAEITNIKQQIGEQSEENNFRNPKVRKSDSLEYKYDKNISEPIISTMIIKDDTKSETDHRKSLVTVQRQEEDKINNFNKSAIEKMIENITEPSKLLVQDSEFKDKNNTEQLVYQENNRSTEQIIDTHPFVVPDILPKVTSLHSLERVLTLKNSHSDLISPKNSYVSQKDFLLNKKCSKSTQLTNENYNAYKHNEKKKSSDTSENTLSSPLTAAYTSSQKTEKDTIYTDMNLESQEINHETSSTREKLDDTDIITIPKMLQLNGFSTDKFELDNHTRTKSQQALSITSKMKPSKDTMESIETVPQSLQEFTDFGSLQYRSSLSNNKKASQKEAENLNTFINDSKTLLPNLKSDININERDDKLLKPSNELTKNNMRSLQILPNAIIHRTSDKSFDNFLEVLDKSESNIEASEIVVSDIKIIVPRPEEKKSFTRSNKNINSISSIAINFGFHTFTNEETGCSIKTFDPSTSLASYPQDKTVTIKTILRKNDSEVKIKIDSETNLTMQMKPTRQLDGSRNMAFNVLNSDTNDRRRGNNRVHSSEILINKDKLLQETLKAVYETLMPIEKNIVKLKEEAESLFCEQLLLKEVLFSKEMKANIIVPNVRNCSCLQREIGLDMKNY